MNACFCCISGISCDYKGRPLHYLYYTLKPQYYELMHVSSVFLVVSFVHGINTTLEANIKVW